MVSGLAVNLFVGLVLTAVYTALYSRHESLVGLSRADALTYVWVLRALYSIFYVPWHWTIATRIRSGELAVDLVRPRDAFVSLFAFDLGRNSAQLVWTTLPVLVTGMLLLPLALPDDVLGWAAAPISFLLGTVLGFQVRFLQEALAFATPSYRGLGRLTLLPLYFLAGFIVPIEFFPAVLRNFAEATPLFGLLTAPVRVVQGRDVAWSLAVQLVWAVLLGLICRWVFSRGVRALELAGG